jgi:dipeptidyl aminopeptidase/acylaminoacyl peptidase
MRSQFGELFLPDGDGPFPVAVMLHGGFWKAQYSRKLQWPVASDLAGRGWAVWNLEYRRLGRLSGGGWPATFDDVLAGIDHLADLRAPLDLSRVVAIGHSAGGHLAAWAATHHGLDAVPRVRLAGAVCQAGVVDLEAAWERRLSGGVVRRLLDGTPAELPERYALASPIRRLPAGIPMLAVHGALDDTVPVDFSRAFARAAGGECDLVVVDGEGHYEHLQPGSRAWGAVLEWLP